MQNTNGYIPAGTDRQQNKAHILTNPFIKPRLTIVLLKAIFTNFNLILGLKHTLMRCTCVHSIHALCAFFPSLSLFSSLVCFNTLDFLYLVKTSIAVNLLVCTRRGRIPFCQLSPEFNEAQVVTHLEEVILVDHTTVGQVLDESVGEGGFPSIGNAAGNKARKDWLMDDTTRPEE